MWSLPLGGLLIGVALSSPSDFLHFALDMDTSRLMVANVASRWCWLPMGLLCKIEYLRELLL